MYLLSFDIHSQASPRLEETYNSATRSQGPIELVGGPDRMHFQQHPEHLRLGQTRPILCVLYLQYVHCELLIALSTEMPVTCSSVNPGFDDTTQQALKLIVLGSSPCLGWLIPRIQAVLDYELVSSSDILVVLFVNGT